MPWWSWIVIWGLMGALLVGTLAALGVMLLRKAMRTADALDELARQFAALGADGADAAPPAFRPAVFQDPAALLFASEVQASDRRHRRQLRRDRLIAQGKLVSHAQMIQRTKPHAR